MILFLVIQAALAVGPAVQARRAAVLRRLSLPTLEPAPLRLLSRSLSTHAPVTTRLDRVVAHHAITLIRSLVQTTAFELLVQRAVVRLRSAAGRKGGVLC